MIRRYWKPIATGAAFVGVGSLLYYRYSRRPKSATFDIEIRTRGPDGKPTTTKHTYLISTMDQVNARLREHAVATTTRRPGIVWKQTTAFFASNDPIEDANSCAIVEKAATETSPAGDLLFFAVMDGHSGFHTSRLLSKVLIPAVALELSALAARSVDPNSSKSESSAVAQLAKSIFSPGSPSSIPLDADPARIRLAIQNAFTNLDTELVNAPLRILAQELGDYKGKPIPDLSKHPMALASMQPARSGILSPLDFFLVRKRANRN